MTHRQFQNVSRQKPQGYARLAVGQRFSKGNTRYKQHFKQMTSIGIKMEETRVCDINDTHRHPERESEYRESIFGRVQSMGKIQQEYRAGEKKGVNFYAMKTAELANKPHEGVFSFIGSKAK